jgi:hypothetical protein
MAYYRLYFLDGSNGRIREFREFYAEDDLTASTIAADWRSIGPMELWCQTRKVKRWPAGTASAGSIASLRAAPRLS